MPFNVGPIELIIVLVIALLVVGPRRLPEMGNAVGKTIREFRKASSDVSEATSLEPEARPDPAPGADTAAVPPPGSASATTATEPAEQVAADTAAEPAADAKNDDV
jgi:TatA/E family protein of Tat protein translocase